MEFNNELGKVSINPTVIKTIVANVLRESYGVSGLANVSPKDGIYQLLGWDNSGKGVHVVLKENNIFIENLTEEEKGQITDVNGELLDVDSILESEEIL